jgi:RimJ/RimL family protein N-acetyltransferase
VINKIWTASISACHKNCHLRPAQTCGCDAVQVCTYEKIDLVDLKAEKPIMLNFNEDYILENKRVRLTPLKATDLNHLIHFATDEPELWMHSLMQASSPDKMKAYIDKAIEGRLNNNAYPFLVYDKLKQQYAGSTRFYDIQTENAALQLGFTWYGKAFQGTRINKNCKYLLLELAFDVLKMERVEFRADYENKRSINAMKSIGCVVEGVLRSNTYKPDGTRRDSIVLSILKSEWNDSVKLQLHENIDH